MAAVSELVSGLDAEFVRLEAVCAGFVTAGVAEWNQTRNCSAGSLAADPPGLCAALARRSGP